MHSEFDNPPSAEERAAARRQAVEIARLLGSKSNAYRRVVIGEPRCSYRIPFHLEDFWFKVLVSETDFVFTGEHRGRDGIPVPFCAALKHPWLNLLATTHLPAISERLGVSVYSTKSFEEGAVSARLLTATAFGLVRRLNFAPIRLLFINPIQIHVVSELISPEQCVEQVRLFRELLLTIFHETYELKRA